MSVQAVVWVLEHSLSEHSDRLVLLSLANHAGGDGAQAFPSIPTIAREARLGESTVRGALDRLKSSGEIVEEGISHLRTRLFRIVMTPAESAPPQNLHPRRIERVTPQNLALEGADSGPKPTTEPTTQPSTGASASNDDQGKVVRHLVKFEGRVVPRARVDLAVRCLEEFNRQAGTKYGGFTGKGRPSESLKRIIGALTRHEDVGFDQAAGAIRWRLANQFWEGAAHPGVVFGPNVFEQALASAGASTGGTMTPELRAKLVGR